MLSVVVPIYNVETFLHAALESLAAQTLAGVEVIMVDDGSTDSSGAIAAEFAARDSRFRLITQANGGLSNARNTGVRHATGTFLTFVDSDDMTPHYAFTTAVRTLEHTGSDFITGKVSRFDNRGAFDVPMQSSSHRASILRTTVTETPELMRDFLPHNKVYRRTFWDSAGLVFPDGLTFEDGPVSVRAHALAKSVDVASVPLYLWRRQDGASPSISRQVTAASFYTDRIQTSLITIDFLREERPELLNAFYAADVQHKFGIMFMFLPKASLEVQELFLAEARPYLKGVPREVTEGLSEEMQQRIRLTKKGDLPGLLTAVARRSAAQQGLDAPPEGGSRLRRSWLARAARSYLRAAPGGTAGQVDEVGFRDGKLWITGFGYLTRLPAEGRFTAANRKILARHEERGDTVRLSFRTTPSPGASVTLPERSPWSASHAGYEAELDVTALKDSSGRWRHGIWQFEMTATSARGAHSGSLRTGVPSAPRALRPIDVDSDTRIIPAVRNGGLILRVEKPGAKLTGCEVDGTAVILTGTASGELPADAQLSLCRVPEVPELSLPIETAPGPDDQTVFTARLPLADVLEAVGPARAPLVSGTPNQLRLELPGRPVLADVDLPSVSLSEGGQTLDVSVGRDGMAMVVVREDLPTVTRIRWQPDGALELSGRSGDHASSPELVVRHSKRREERVFPLEVGADGEWRVQIGPVNAPLVGLRTGRWWLVLRTRDDHDVDFPYVATALPDSGALVRDRWYVEGEGPHRLMLRVGPRLSDDERGKYNQRILREVVYPGLRESQPLRDVVLYSSFRGQQYSDSPRALHEYLSTREDASGLEHVWVTRDSQTPVPEGVRTVEAFSREWYEALATSRYVVNNTHLPYWFRRRKGQTVAQTWHGTPFKRIGFDMPSVQFANAKYLEKLELEAPNWSFMLSPNSFSTPILRRSLGYKGEVCEIGSPRNDLLVSGDREAISAEVRRDLGIPAGKKILLYAPTWRDHEFHGSGQYTFELRLDISKFTEALRDEYVLLVRRHSNTIDDLLGHGDPFVFDVANYPDVRQLMVAADVLITDYSSIAMDFVTTGRPILFYAYDLAHYRDQVRGFNLDLENDGPGPVLETTEEVVSTLSDLDAVAARYEGRYAASRHLFGHAEDGKATERFAERLLADRE